MDISRFSSLSSSKARLNSSMRSCACCRRISSSTRSFSADMSLADSSNFSLSTLSCSWLLRICMSSSALEMRSFSSSASMSASCALALPSTSALYLSRKSRKRSCSRFFSSVTFSFSRLSRMARPSSSVTRISRSASPSLTRASSETAPYRSSDSSSRSCFVCTRRRRMRPRVVTSMITGKVTPARRPCDARSVVSVTAVSFCRHTAMAVVRLLPPRFSLSSSVSLLSPCGT
mmetsp:Transcript_19460/g.68920  ORF Transcript_19460/g.68920 Transcript_19460/m.68920 type:complete len:232 (+) Transcript_19460:1184-1879(+)